MNPYEEKLEARKNRYQDKAEQLKTEAATLEYPSRLDGKIAYYEAKANAVGSAGISADDPDALKKLASQHAELQALRQRMARANRIIAEYPHFLWKGELLKLGFSEKEANFACTPPLGKKPGFNSATIQACTAKMHRIMARMTRLEQERNQATEEFPGKNYTLRFDTEENRAMFLFPAAPSEEIRTTLKNNGFRWSPRRRAWVRQLTENARYASRRIAATLESGSLQ